MTVIANDLTSWIYFFVVKLRVSQLQEITLFYGNRSFITVFTRVHHRHTHPFHADQSHAFKMQINVIY